jgi:hypothetical protein
MFCDQLVFLPIAGTGHLKSRFRDVVRFILLFPLRTADSDRKHPLGGGPSSTRNLSRLFFETSRGVVDHRTRPEANAKDKPKRNVEKCHTAP